MVHSYTIRLCRRSKNSRSACLTRLKALFRDTTSPGESDVEQGLLAYPTEEASDCEVIVPAEETMAVLQYPMESDSDVKSSQDMLL